MAPADPRRQQWRERPERLGVEIEVSARRRRSARCAPFLRGSARLPRNRCPAPVSAKLPRTRPVGSAPRPARPDWRAIARAARHPPVPRRSKCGHRRAGTEIRALDLQRPAHRLRGGALDQELPVACLRLEPAGSGRRCRAISPFDCTAMLRSPGAGSNGCRLACTVTASKRSSSARRRCRGRAAPARLRSACSCTDRRVRAARRGSRPAAGVVPTVTVVGASSAASPLKTSGAVRLLMRPGRSGLPRPTCCRSIWPVIVGDTGRREAPLAWRSTAMRPVAARVRRAVAPPQ